VTTTPIACTLNGEQLSARRRGAAAVAARALIEARATDSGARFRFQAEAEADLLDLIEAESSCCSFLRFDLDRDDETLSLTVEGPSPALPLIFELFGLAEEPSPR
jgi:hypothetical protein